MKYHFKHIMLLGVLLSGGVFSVYAQETRTASPLWTDVPELRLELPEGSEVILPEKYRLLELRTDAIQAILQQAPAQKPGGLRTSPILLDIPVPGGTFQQFRIENAPVMHPDLARKFPEINSYAGIGVQDPGSKIYFSYSPLGFNALIISPELGYIFIEPVHHTDIEHYLCYFGRDHKAPGLLGDCSMPSDAGIRTVNPQTEAYYAGDCQLRTYRAAIAASAEFTNAAGGVNPALANINAIITTVNGLFITELAIQLQIVANNNQILFTNAGTDGFTDGNQNAMAGENQAIIDGTIGAANYDIGHAVGTGGGGWAGVSLQIGNVCSATKANAATIFGTVPIPGWGAMGFWHEMGHQFGANHTFNDNTTGSCTPGQQNAATAYETGSGTTIMSYAGTCGVMDVIGGRDQYYHAISLQEIANYVTAGGGSGCPVTTPLANNAPTVNAPAVAVYNLPISTPFMLTATANDPDGDPLVFCWEQWDPELITNPPASTATQGPVFRSTIPAGTPTRFFPNLAAILNGTSPTWEVLPSVSRTMDFRVTVRDNAPGGGCTDEDDIALEFFDNAGPFIVTAPGMDACFAAEGPMQVDWNVAGTNAGSVNTANVDILLSIDGGFTYPFTLVSGTPNDGTHTVTLPDITTETGRVMVRGSGNIFFNISPADISIECISNLVVTDNPASGTYEARQQVSTMGTVTVLAGDAAEFLAGVEVLLNPGFSALLGCDFLARIQPCDACTGPRPLAFATLEAPENPRIHIHYIRPEIEIIDRVEEPSGGALTIFPNPFTGQFTIHITMLEAGMLYLDLTDITGRSIKLLQPETYLESGVYEMIIPAGDLAPGVYECRIITDSGQQQRKLIKLR